MNGPSDVPVGAPANYEVVVTNQDETDLDGLILRLDIPQGVVVQPGTPSRGEFDFERAPDGASLVVWGFDKLPAGQTATAPIKLAAKTAKDFGIAMDWTIAPVSQQTKVHVISPQLSVVMDGAERR